jgi:hypothetical protein
MSRLPHANLNMVPSQELEELLMMNRIMENCVVRCPDSGATSNVAIPVLTNWLQTRATSDIQTDQYAALVAHIQSAERKHLDT